MKYIVGIFVLVFTLSSVAQNSEIIQRIRAYKEKYKAICAGEKITDNRGNGYEDLYGTRNMRPILHGVAYRGGANNFYHRSDKRDNHNPLPQDGLQNLCEEGFSKAVYLYSTNFKESPKTVICNGKSDTIKYEQNSGMARETQRKIMTDVYNVIIGKTDGPIYFHCWNGWHQSGYVSSMILRQFCGISSQEALDYWIANTDGVNKGYENVKKRVLEFQPFDDFKISEEIKKEICPCMKK